MWPVLFGGAVVTIAFTFFFGTRNHVGTAHILGAADHHGAIRSRPPYRLAVHSARLARVCPPIAKTAMAAGIPIRRRCGKKRQRTAAKRHPVHSVCRAQTGSIKAGSIKALAATRDACSKEMQESERREHGLQGHFSFDRAKKGLQFSRYLINNAAPITIMGLPE
jgi:hypothetical protein